jgi:hypothetical protein
MRKLDGARLGANAIFCEWGRRGLASLPHFRVGGEVRPVVSRSINRVDNLPKF